MSMERDKILSALEDVIDIIEAKRAQSEFDLNQQSIRHQIICELSAHIAGQLALIVDEIRR